MAPPRVKSTTSPFSSGQAGALKATTSKKTTGASSPFASGQSGAAGSQAAKREVARAQYFDNRSDITADRLDRRIKQAQEYEDFKKTLKVAEGTTNLYQASEPVWNPQTGRFERTTLADKAQELAFKYGPTFSEIGSDMGYAIGSMAKGAGDILRSGSFGIIGVAKAVGNYFLDKANKGYDKLNSVQQEIFDNPDKYPYASKVPQVEAVNNSRQLALEADRDALGLELDALLAEREAENRFRYDNPTVDMRSPTREELDPMDIGYVESGQFKEDLQKSGIITVDDPATQEPLADSTKIPGTNTPLGDLKEELKKQNYNDFQITGIINEMTQRIISGEDVNAPIENIGEPDAQTYGGLFEGSPMRLEIPQERYNFSENILAPVNILEDKEYGEIPYIDPYLQSFLEGEGKAPVGFYGEPGTSLDRLQEDEGVQSDLSIPNSSIYSGTQVTAYNNPGNLQFAGQEGAIEGQTYGNNFAVFPSAEAGISALKNDLTAKVSRSNKVDDIIGEYAPKADNPESFNNYVEFVKNTVGETVEPNELDDLTRSVIQFENKPSIANQYLTMVADGGMIDKQLKSLQNGLQNMYNGIPSVKRR